MTTEHMFYYNFPMSIWHRILYWLGLRRDPGPRYYELNEGMHTTLATLAEYAGKSEDELAEDLLASGLDSYYTRDELWQRWESLSPREKDAAAFACLGCTNPQIAEQMGISVETVKTHMRNVLTKFNLHSKGELRMALSGWDFSAWLE